MREETLKLVQFSIKKGAMIIIIDYGLLLSFEIWICCCVNDYRSHRFHDFLAIIIISPPDPSAQLFSCLEIIMIINQLN